MKKMDELMKEQIKLLDEMESLNAQVSKKQQAIDSVEQRIEELKEQQDFGAFKFVHSNMATIIQKVAPKHKVPEPREISLYNSSADDSFTKMDITVPWSNDECSDENPCNINVCPRCTLIHFQNLLDRLLAGYYSK